MTRTLNPIESVSSGAEFARQLGVSRGTIANWKSGYSLPDTVMCATLAGSTGLPLAHILGIVGEARVVSREEKVVWRKLAATAMALCLAVPYTT
ncbi:helix-turn-helix domain-containing protein [Stenotrophomonas pavanii]|uniref:helix-turn-helix domain-containing protein n=1 Tax=Stenotrophomonas pavanii TaxID=487698 RepID=UPI003F95837A